MDLYIMLENGQPVNHPMLTSTLLMLYPGINFDDLPEEICRFVRVPKPDVGIFQLLEPEDPTYEMIDGVYQDVWHLRDMTEEEKEAKINSIEATKPYASWGFNRETFEFIPPTPHPESGDWTWNEETLSWVEYIEPTDTTE